MSAADAPDSHDLAAALAVFDPVAEHQDEHAFRKAAEGGLKTSSGGVRVALQALAIALSPMLAPGNRGEPFRPLLIIQGRRSAVPEDLTEPELDALEAALPLARHAALRARIADVLWCCRRRGRGSIGSAAVAAYCEAAQHRQQGEDWHDADALIERALHLAASLGRAGAAERVMAAEAVMAMARHDREADRWGSFERLHQVMRLFGVGEPGPQAHDCEGAAKAALAAGNAIQAAEIFDEAAAWWSSAGDKDKAAAASMASVEALVRVAHATKKAASALAAAHWLEAAIKKLRTLPLAIRGEREAELASQLREWQGDREAELKTASIEVDVTDIVRQAEAAVAGLPFIPALAAFATIYRSPPEEKRRRDAEEAVRQHPMQYLVNRIIIDDEGKTVRRLPTLTGDDASHEAVVRQAMIVDANRNQSFIGANIIEPARHTIMSEHPLRERQFRQILIHSAFVPAGREDSWAAGLVAGFAGEVPTALHLLIPQLEHALRTQVRLNGHPATTMNPAGEQEDWTFSNLLQSEHRSRVASIIGEDTAFDLRTLMLEKEGPNLRNRMSHGLLADGALRDGCSRYLFWLCVRLCMLPLIEANEGGPDPDSPAGDESPS